VGERAAAVSLRKEVSTRSVSRMLIDKLLKTRGQVHSVDTNVFFVFVVGKYNTHAGGDACLLTVKGCKVQGWGAQNPSVQLPVLPSIVHEVGQAKSASCYELSCHVTII
jgi:hypothetical protein